MSDRTVTFSELADESLLEIGAGRPRSAGLDRYPLPILRVADVLDGKIESPFRDYAPDTYRQAMGPKISRPGDIVLTTKGTVGRVAMMPSQGPDFAYSPQLCYFRPIANGPLIPRYLYYWFKSKEFWNQANALKGQTDMADFLSLSDINSLKMRLPSIEEQAGVIEVLAALDEKIVVNDSIATTCRTLGTIKFKAALSLPGAQKVELSELVVTLVRGVAPKYSEDGDALTTINQKCIRNGRVRLEPARKTLREKVREPKFLLRNDVLVNSTGVGTLGRVARWTHNLDATVDSHVTIARFDPNKVDPVCAGFAVLNAQSDIEALGEGSTGQIELSRVQLGAYRLEIPSHDAMQRLRPILDRLEDRGDSALAESTTLAKLRDTLLPKLMSGEIRVRDAEKAVEDAV